jgi:hypothetical protein
MYKVKVYECASIDFLYKLCSAENIEFCCFRLNVSLVFLKQLYRQQFDISFKVNSNQTRRIRIITDRSKT